MSAVLDRLTVRSAGSVLLFGRLLLAWIFLHEGFVLAANLDGAITAMGKLGVPAPLAIAAIGLQLVAGVALAAGWGVRLAAGALGLFCVATAICFHANFASHNEMLHFEKDLAIAGGMFVLHASETLRRLRLTARRNASDAKADGSDVFGAEQPAASSGRASIFKSASRAMRPHTQGMVVR